MKKGTLHIIFNSVLPGADVSSDFLTFLELWELWAKPPIGDRRFRRPEPLAEEDSWEGERDFHEEMPRCYQLSVVPGFHMGQEDCLFLNVYTPVGNKELLPVMVYLHGGGFVAGEGSSTMFGPHFFMDEGVLLVTVQYRIGIFGFLSTGGPWERRFVGPA